MGITDKNNFTSNISKKFKEKSSQKEALGTNNYKNIVKGAINGKNGHINKLQSQNICLNFIDNIQGANKEKANKLHGLKSLSDIKAKIQKSKTLTIVDLEKIDLTKKNI